MSDLLTTKEKLTDTLRSLAERETSYEPWFDSGDADACREAADEIERLQAERDRLREALEAMPCQCYMFEREGIKRKCDRCAALEGTK